MTFARPTLMLMTRMEVATNSVFSEMTVRNISSILIPPSRNTIGSITFFIIRIRPKVLGAINSPLDLVASSGGSRPQIRAGITISTAIVATARSDLVAIMGLCLSRN
uniref:(northern house mosquito) hypothetical protein n=1 Tax=Culex pipiens TaxID=7175 RepID=A0A8D8IZR4_CULPI